MKFLLLTAYLSVLVFVVWQTIKRADRRRLWWRLLAVVGAFAALLLLWLPPGWTSRVQWQQALLLTEGAHPDSVQGVLQQLQPRPVIFTTDSAVARTFSALRPALIPDLNYLHRYFPSVRGLHVTGFGLPEYELNHLDSLQVVPHLSLPPSSLRSVNWPNQFYLGDSLRIQVTGKKSDDAPVWCWLAGASGKLDSVEVKGEGLVNFQLKALPKTAGQQIFYLQWQQEGRMIHQKIPFIVLERQPLRVLILEKYPTFETKFLKNWLAESGNSVAVRAEISKAKFSTEFLNREKISLDQLTPKLLQAFDVLLLGGETLNELSRTEQSAIRQAIGEGLGMLITTADRLPRNEFTQAFVVQENATAQEQLQIPVWLGAPKGMTAIPIVPFTLRQTSGMKSLVFTQDGQSIAGFHPARKGKTGVLVAGSTYTWVLAGKLPLHRAFWSFLLQEISRQKPVSASWQTELQFPLVNEPVRIYLTNGNNYPPILLLSDSTRLYTSSKEDNWLQWQGTYWPRRGGWQKAETAKGEVFSWYVYGQYDWEPIRQHEKYQATLAYTNRRSAKQRFAAAPEVVTQQETSPLVWFALLFLFSAGFLWLERKW